MSPTLSLRTRIVWILALVALVSAGMSSFIGYRTARTALEAQSFDQLTAVREMKATQVEDYFGIIVDQIVTLSADRTVVEAMRELDGAFQTTRAELSRSPAEWARFEDELRGYYQEVFLARLARGADEARPLADYWPSDPSALALQSLYLSENPFETGAKQLLDRAPQATRYNDAHGRYHPYLRDFADRFGYYDLFLVNAETGSIVYSVFKEVDFATSLLDGPYRRSSFAEAFLTAAEARSGTFVRLVDYAPYEPSYRAPAAFIASPIFDGTERVGVLVFQMPVDRIDGIMTSGGAWRDVGLGASGEAYLVGSDRRLRTQSRFLIEDRDAYLSAIGQAGAPVATMRAIANLGSAIGLQEVETPGTRSALAGESGRAVFRDYRGVRVLSSYRPLDLPDLDWAILSEIDEDEAFAPVRRLRRSALLWFAILVPLVLASAFLLARSVTSPLTRLSETAAQLAAGHLGASFDVHRSDEIGQLSESFDRMRLSIREMVDRQARAIEALSTPLIPLGRDVVIMPVVGELDAARCRTIQETLIAGLHESGARNAILDLTGVPHIVPEDAAELARAAQAAQLLGARAIISGLRPQVASALADADFDLGGVATARTLREAVDDALAST